ncbi:hypothetical protein BgiBS90_033741, partial [Biomphalaria glabrata]
MQLKARAAPTKYCHGTTRSLAPRTSTWPRKWLTRTASGDAALIKRKTSAALS